MFRISLVWLVRKLATVYVETFRNIPALLQIFFWYFVVLQSLPASRDSLDLLGLVFFNNRGLFVPAPTMPGGLGWIVLAVVIAVMGATWLRGRARIRHARTGKRLPVAAISVALVVGLPLLTAFVLPGSWETPALGRFSYEGGFVLMPEFIALAVGLSVYNASYISEIVRSGFESIPRGQTEAAEALGLPRFNAFRLVLFPQALRVIIPPLTTVYLNLFKSTSLAAAIAYPEVVSVFVGTVNNLVGQPVAIMAITLVIYVAVSLGIAVFMNWYNRRIALTGA